jgi:hypothetical protein
MPTARPARVLGGFQKVHTKLGGSSKPVRFVRFGISQASDWAEISHDGDEITELRYPAIVKDKPDESLQAYFEGGIGADQKIFIILAHSVADKLPYNTLTQRCEDFFNERTGNDRGGIYYGDDLYIIEQPPFAKTTLGTVVPQWIILATAVKKKTIIN